MSEVVFRPLLLLDAASLLYRAYHSVPELRAPDGTKVHAAMGFLNYVSRLLPDRRPGRFYAALDNDWRPAFRVEALPTYKTHRLAGPDDPPDDVGLQFPILLEIFDAIGLSYAEAEGYEAEDVIATLAARTDERVEIVTGDRDLFAIVRDPRVKVLYTLRGVSDLAEVDEAWIANKYGIPGDRYLDYALLRGDPSDGLPGVAGIGEKTASALLRRYGSLDVALAAPDLDPAVRLKLKRSAEYLDAARRVVAPVAEVPIRGGDGTIPPVPRDPDRARALGERYRLSGSVDRLIAALPSVA
ncbi:MAG TPA: 5'-3' exonuclease [Candidatus Limnocylindria bacterium]